MAIEEVFDYIVSIPELDAYGLEHIDTAKHQVKLTDLDTERPVLTIGPCVFHGQHQHMIGTAAVFDTARAVSGTAVPGLRQGSLDAMPIAPPVASLTRRAIVFKRVTGDVSAITLKRATSRLRTSSGTSGGATA